MAVPYNSVNDCTEKQRKIIIVSIRPSSKIEIKYNADYCHSRPPKKIIYDLYYIPITDEIDSDKKNFNLLLTDEYKLIITDDCNEMLIRRGFVRQTL